MDRGPGGQRHLTYSWFPVAVLCAVIMQEANEATQQELEALREENAALREAFQVQAAHLQQLQVGMLTPGAQGQQGQQKVRRPCGQWKQ